MNKQVKWCATRHGDSPAAHYRYDIDGLRAVAVALVVLFHAFPTLIPGGFIGVDVFFVISGFLITNQILVEQTKGRFSIISFYRRRVRRILPALIVVIFGTMVLGWLVLLPLPYERLGREALAGALFVPNLLFWHEVGYFDAVAISKPLLHLWSLGVEEQFYLIWPLILIVTHKLRFRPFGTLALLSVVSLTYSSIATFSDPAAAFYSPLSRLWELGIGALLAVRPISLRQGVWFASGAGLAAILGSSLLFSEKTMFPGLFATLPVFGSAAILVAPARLLAWRPLREIGLLSYPLYLWHWPLLSFATTENFNGASHRVIIIGASVILAWLTMRFVEFPFRFGAWRSRAPAILFSALFATALVGAAVLCSAGVLIRFPAEIRPVLATMNYQFRDQARVGPCWIAAATPFEKYAPECRIGDTLIWGDSYSALLGTGLPKPYAQFSRDGCLPIARDAMDQCAVSNRAILAEITKHPPKRVILFGAWVIRVPNWQIDQSLLPSFKRTIDALRAAGVGDIVVVGPSPSWAPTLPDGVFRYWKDHGTIPDRLPVPAVNYQATDTVMRKSADEEGIRFESIFDLLCNADGCLTHTPASTSTLLVWDQGHMTVQGATYIVKMLRLD